jgi:hypothetical protein
MTKRQGARLWSTVTQIIHNGQPSHDDTVERLSILNTNTGPKVKGGLIWSTCNNICQSKRNGCQSGNCVGHFFFLIHSLVDYISQVLELCWYFFGFIKIN